MDLLNSRTDVGESFASAGNGEKVEVDSVIDGVVVVEVGVPVAVVVGSTVAVVVDDVVGGTVDVSVVLADVTVVVGCVVEEETSALVKQITLTGQSHAFFS